MRPALLSLAASLLVASALPGPALRADPQLEPEDYLNLLRIDLRACKAQVVAEMMELTSEENEVFWPIYREYDAELGKLNVERINLLREFAERYTSIDEEMARDYSRRSFDFMRRRLDLVEKYSRRIDKSLSAVIAARFAQLENHLLMLVDVQLAADTPLVRRLRETEVSAFTP